MHFEALLVLIELEYFQSLLDLRAVRIFFTRDNTILADTNGGRFESDLAIFGLSRFRVRFTVQSVIILWNSLHRYFFRQLGFYKRVEAPRLVCINFQGRFLLGLYLGRHPPCWISKTRYVEWRLLHHLAKSGLRTELRRRLLLRRKHSLLSPAHLLRHPLFFDLLFLAFDLELNHFCAQLELLSTHLQCHVCIHASK